MSDVLDSEEGVDEHDAAFANLGLMSGILEGKEQ